MKRLIPLSFCALFVASMNYSFAAKLNVEGFSALSTTCKFNGPVQVEKYRYLILQFNKYETILMEKMVSELNSYENKIMGAEFDKTAHKLTILYISAITLDDILQVVSKYAMDFEKIGGSEL